MMAASVKANDSKSVWAEVCVYVYVCMCVHVYVVHLQYDACDFAVTQ